MFGLRAPNGGNTHNHDLLKSVLRYYFEERLMGVIRVYMGSMNENPMS
jgi:hypothetical protein